MIAITTSIEMIAAINKKMSIAMLSKNLFLVLLLCIFNVWPFCLYYCTSPFSVSGTLSNLLSKGVDCRELVGFVPVLSKFDSHLSLIFLVVP